MRPTTQQLIASVKREIAMRKTVYPRWVRAERLSQKFADHEILCMETILEDLVAKSRKEFELS